MTIRHIVLVILLPAQIAGSDVAAVAQALQTQVVPSGRNGASGPRLLPLPKGAPVPRFTWPMRIVDAPQAAWESTWITTGRPYCAYLRLVTSG